MAAVATTREDRSNILAVADAASGDENPEVRVQVHDRSVTLRGDAARAVLGLFRALATEAMLNVEALPAVLTTGQAADLLGVSRPTVVSLIDAGKLPATLAGSHRRVQLSDVLAYRERHETTRRQALRDLTRVSEELGLYDA